MNNKQPLPALPILATSTTLLALALSLLVPVNADARGFSATRTGRNGGVYTRQVSQTPGHFSASGSATLPNGKSASRSFASQATETGRTTSATATGFNGKTATCGSTSTQTETGHTRSAQAVGPNGGTASKEINVSKENGVTTRTVTTATTPPAKP
jgi:hypothetical protein